MIDSLCVFGDSIMKGVIFDAIRGKYIYLEKTAFLNILGRYNSSVRVDNFAKFGCTITTGQKNHRKNMPTGCHCVQIHGT